MRTIPSAVHCRGVDCRPCFAAEAFPSKPIRWIIPFPPGGGTDMISRNLATEMLKGLGKVRMTHVPYGVMAPAGLPKDILTRLNTELVRIMKLPEVQKRFEGEGVLSPNSPEEFGGFIRNEISKWSKAVRESGAKVD